MGIFICNLVALLFFGLFTSSLCLDQLGLKSPENYGPYVMTWHSAELCKGPKTVNLTQETFHLNKELGQCVFNITSKMDIRIDEVKVTVFSASNGAKNTLWNYRIKDPCRHFMVASLISHFTTDNCVVKKGTYLFQQNFNDASKIFLGNSFFYGQFIFKSIITSKAGNVHCFLTNVSFSKRN